MTMLMRVLRATALAGATLAVFCFVGALPALLDSPVEGFQAGEAGALGMYFMFGLGFGVAAATWVFLFAFALLSPASRKRQRGRQLRRPL